MQYRLPLQAAAVDRDCRPMIMGGRLVTTVAGRTRYPKGLEQEDENRAEILLQSRAAILFVRSSWDKDRTVKK